TVVIPTRRACDGWQGWGAGGTGLLSAGAVLDPGFADAGADLEGSARLGQAAIRRPGADDQGVYAVDGGYPGAGSHHPTATDGYRSAAGRQRAEGAGVLREDLPADGNRVRAGGAELEHAAACPRTIGCGTGRRRVHLRRAAIGRIA